MGDSFLLMFPMLHYFKITNLSDRELEYFRIVKLFDILIFPISLSSISNSRLLREFHIVKAPFGCHISGVRQEYADCVMPINMYSAEVEFILSFVILLRLVRKKLEHRS